MNKRELLSLAGAEIKSQHQHYQRHFILFVAFACSVVTWILYRMLILIRERTERSFFF